MILIEGALRFPAGALAKIVDDARVMVAASRKEEGCIAYSLTVDLVDPDVLWINERFVDETALAEHRNSSHMSVWRKVWQAVDGVERDMRYYRDPIDTDL